VSKPLHQVLAEYIEACGHAVTVVPFSENGDHHAVRFKSKGQRYQVNVYGDDPQFLHLTFSCKLPDSRPSDDNLRRIALEVQDTMKAVKLAFDGDAVVSQVEQFLSFESLDLIFWRCAGVAEAGAHEFFQRLGRASADLRADAHAAAQRFLSTVEPQADDQDAGNE
jgi:hypothetical protein